MKASICLLLVAYTAFAAAASVADTQICTEQGLQGLIDACTLVDDKIEEYTECLKSEGQNAVADEFINACDNAKNSEFAKEFLDCYSPNFGLALQNCADEYKPSVEDIMDCAVVRFQEVIESCQPNKWFNVPEQIKESEGIVPSNNLLVKI